MDAALTEVPPPSLVAFGNRYGYSYVILRKYLPDQCRAIQERYREHYAASIERRQAANRLPIARRRADLCLNRMVMRMAVPHSLDYAIARELLAEVRRAIANRKPTGKPCGKIDKDTTLPDDLRRPNTPTRRSSRLLIKLLPS
jgi:hypothetical protein